MTQEIINKIKYFINNNQLIEAEKLADKYKDSKSTLILYLSGLIKNKLNKNEEALEYLKEIKEKLPEVLLLMANSMENLSRIDEAINSLNEAIKVNASYWQAHFNKGLILMKLKKNDLLIQAKKSFEKVLQINSNNLDAEFYLGLIAANDDLSVAEKHYRKVISLNEKHQKAHAELGKILLFHGKLEEGWDEYKWRFDYLEKIYPKNITNINIWNGKNANKQRLLVFREQGLGDEILYASCYEEIISKTSKCYFVCDNRLTNLFKNSFPKGDFLSEEIFSKNTDLKEIQPTARVQSTLLPKYLRKTFRDFPKKKYLEPNKKNCEIWKKKLLNDSKKKLKVGIAWTSGENKKDDNLTSIQKPIEFKLNEWRHFLSVDNLFLVNLMYKNVKNEINNFNLNNKNKIFSYENIDMKNDIDNVAALISNLDIVISAQTWVGDFASALGLEVFKFHNIYSLTRLGQRDIPWNNSKIFDIKNNSWKESFELIKSSLNKRIIK